MDTKNKMLVSFLIIINTILIVFACNMLLNIRSELQNLKNVLATKADLQQSIIQTAGAELFFQEEKCTRCHTERRFAGMHGTKSELLQVANKLKEHPPDAKINEKDLRTIHASLILLKCGQCHSSDMIKRIALKTEEEQLAIIKGMQERPGAEIAPDEVNGILKSFHLLLGF